MAVKDLTVEASDLPNMALLTWATLGSADEGEPAKYPHYPDKTLHLTGALGVGGAVDILGSNDGVTWKILTDPLGNNLSFTAVNIIKLIHENPLYIKPNMTGGNGTTAFDIVVTAAKGTR